MYVPCSLFNIVKKKKETYSFLLHKININISNYLQERHLYIYIHKLRPVKCSATPGHINLYKEVAF